MSSGEGYKPISYEKITRPNGTESSKKPKILLKPDKFADDAYRRSGAEGSVYDAVLNYKDLPKEGFVFKSLHNFKVVTTYDEDVGTEDLEKEEAEKILKDTLDQWARIRAVRQILREEHKSGFNIPGTIRGVRGDEYGLLISDLTEGGKKEVIDLKMLRAYPGRVTPEQWNEIKRGVLNDLNLSKLYGIKLVSGNAGLDPWLVAIDKETGECRLYISDIGMYSSEELDVFAHENPDRNNSEYLDSLARQSLEDLEKSLQQSWEEEENSPPLQPGEVKQDRDRFKFFRGS